MFKRKLLALDYHNATEFTSKDEASFRALIVWLEDQKIRHYKIEDRGPLRNITAGDWEQHLEQYLKDVGCSIDYKQTSRDSFVDWILGYAIRLEYGDNVDKYKAASKVGTKSQNPLDSIDYESADFKVGVESLAGLLQIPPYADHFMLCKAICNLVKERLSKPAIEKAKHEVGTKPKDVLPLDEVELGFDTPGDHFLSGSQTDVKRCPAADYISKEAARVLRLLHIRDLRQLQTAANEAIVKVQALTANPKTDSRLGKVGR